MSKETYLSNKSFDKLISDLKTIYDVLIIVKKFSDTIPFNTDFKEDFDSSLFLSTTAAENIIELLKIEKDGVQSGF